MENAQRPVFIKAKVVLISHSVGGRKIPPAKKGYRGAFFYSDKDCDAIHDFVVDGDVPFGEEIEDLIVLLNSDHRVYLREGSVFLIREGFKTIAYGKIINIE